MFTLEQLTLALSALKESFDTFNNFHSLSIRDVSATNVYYTDGEARGAIAMLIIGRKNPNHTPGHIDNPDTAFCCLYIFPDGKIKSHFMKWNDSFPNTSDYVTHVKNWLAALA